MLHLYCDEPTPKAEAREIPKVPRSTKALLRPVKNAPVDVREIPKAEAREIPKVPRSTKALLRPAKSTVPNVPRNARAALK